MKIINRIRIIRKKGLIFKLQRFIFCFLICSSISLVGGNQRMFLKYGHMKHLVLKTALASDDDDDTVAGSGIFIMILFGFLVWLYLLHSSSSSSSSSASSNDLRILSNLDTLLDTNQLPNGFSREEIIRMLEGFLMSKLLLLDTGSIKNWKGDQKNKLMILAIILSSTQSNNKREIRTLLGGILNNILDKTRQTLTLVTEEAGIKTKFVEAIELIALNLRKNADRNPFIKKDGIVDNIEGKLELTLKLMIDNHPQDQEIRDKANQGLNTLNRLRGESSIPSDLLHGPDLKIKTVLSVFNTSGINKFIEPLGEKEITELIGGFWIFRLFENNGILMKILENPIEFWAEDQKTKLMTLSIGLSLLLISSSEKSQDILLSELENILSKVRRSDYKGVENRLIDALGFITFNLLKTNNQSIIDDSYIRPTLTLMFRKFARHKNPMIRSIVLDSIERVGQINIEKKGELNVYELNEVLMRLMHDNDPSISEKARIVIDNLNLKPSPSCFGVFLKYTGSK